MRRSRLIVWIKRLVHRERREYRLVYRNPGSIFDRPDLTSEWVSDPADLYLTTFLEESGLPYFPPGHFPPHEWEVARRHLTLEERVNRD